MVTAMTMTIAIAIAITIAIAISIAISMAMAMTTTTTTISKTKTKTVMNSTAIEMRYTQTGGIIKLESNINKFNQPINCIPCYKL